MNDTTGLDPVALRSTLAGSHATWTPAGTARRRALGATPPLGALSVAGRERLGAANARPAAAGGPGLPSAANAHAAAAGGPALPSAVDLRPYALPVRDQGTRAASVAFGTIAMVEAARRCDAKDPTLAFDLSEAHLHHGHGRGRAHGWWPDNALNALRDKGVVDEACYPYAAGHRRSALCADAEDRLFLLTTWKHLDSVEEIKGRLAAAGPLTACMSVYEDFFAYGGGVYRHVAGDLVGGHCVCVVGYDDDAQAWTVKNSWGTSWGEDGFFRIGYGECGIDYQMWCAEVPRHDDGEWLRRRAVNGVWMINETEGAAAYLTGAGWKRLSAVTEFELRALLATLSRAHASQSRVDVRLVRDRIAEVFLF